MNGTKCYDRDEECRRCAKRDKDCQKAREDLAAAKARVEELEKAMRKATELSSSHADDANQNMWLWVGSSIMAGSSRNMSPRVIWSVFGVLRSHNAWLTSTQDAIKEAFDAGNIRRQINALRKEIQRLEELLRKCKEDGY
jgi:hypothetical protein